jgi:hypothetical protein
VTAQGAPPKRDKEGDDGNSGTIDEELDSVSRRAPLADVAARIHFEKEARGRGWLLLI